MTSLLSADVGRTSKTRSCPACLGTCHRFWDFKNKFRLSRCPTCGVIFATDQADRGEVKELYDHYYDRAQFEMPQVVAASLDRLVSSLAGYRQTGCWLDIGYGEGGLLTIAQRRGWSCFGTEISPSALAFGQKKGWVVTADPLADSAFTAHGFDVITMVEILEHIPAPDQILGSVAHLLRPGGIFYLTTPNGDSLNRRILGADWSVFSPPEHLVIWTAKGLCQTLARNGLRPARIRTEGLNPSEIVRRLRPRRSGPAPSRNEAGFKLNETMSSSPWRRRLKTGINCCLSLVRLGDSLKVWATRPTVHH